MEALSASDVALLSNRNGYGYDGNMLGENGFIWFFLGAAMGNGGGWFGGNNNRQDAVTESALCNAMNFNDLESSVGRLGDQQTQLAMQSMRDQCQSTATLSAQIAEIAPVVERCCCDVNRNIDAVRYEAAQNTASINATTTASTQKVLDAICGLRMEMKDDRINQMQQQINQLQLQSALSGVVRYPSQITYNGGTSPFCGCGCGNNNGGFANI